MARSTPDKNPVRYSASPYGDHVLSHSPELLDAVRRFISAPDHGERAVRPEPTPEDPTGSCNLLGSGKFSETHAVGKMALTVSTPTTGSLARWSRPGYVASLPAQFEYMRSIGCDLDGISGGHIRVPDQHFVVSKGDGGGHLLGQENMEGWIPIGTWLASENIDRQKGGMELLVELEVFNHTVERVKAVAGFMGVLGLGLRDVGRLDSPVSKFNNSILVPTYTADISRAPLTLIGQPNEGFKGLMATALAGIRSEQFPTVTDLPDLAA